MFAKQPSHLFHLLQQFLQRQFTILGSIMPLHAMLPSAPQLPRYLLQQEGSKAFPIQEYFINCVVVLHFVPQPLEQFYPLI